MCVVCVNRRPSVSEKYAPERDREVLSSGDAAEALHWVPKEALELTRSFLAGVGPTDRPRPQPPRYTL